MKNNFIIEIIVSLLLIILLVAIINPLDWLMTTNTEMVILVVLVLVFAVFAAFIMRERSRDEREVMHKLLASRYAYLLGAAALVVVIVIQSLDHDLDPWLPLVLGIMVLTKIGGHIYSSLRK